MLEDNEEIVRRIYEGINQLGAAGLYALPDPARRDLYERFFDAELELRQSTELIFDSAGTFHGYDGFVDATRELVEVFGDIRFDVGEAVQSGNQVVFEVRALGSGRKSGIPVQTPRIGHLWELKDGLVRRWVVYPTLDEALEAAGLS